MTDAPTADVSSEAWAATPAPVQRLVTQLLPAVSQLQAQLVVLRADSETLRADNERLTARVAELEENQRTNTGNSSMPPSSDPPSTPPRSRSKAKR